MSTLLFGILVALFSFLGSLGHYEYQIYKATHKAKPTIVVEQISLPAPSTTITTSRDGIEAL